MRRTLLLLSSLLVAGCSAPAAMVDEMAEIAADPDFELRLTGCREVLAMFPVTAEHARRYVPEPYEPLGSGGAIAFSALKVCEDVMIDGRSIGPGSTVDSGVFIEAPDGSDGFHYYQTWWITDSVALASRLGVLGWNASVAETSLEGPAPAPYAGEVQAEVVWDGGYSIAARIGGIPRGTDPHAVGWQEGLFGTVRVVKDLPGTEAGGGSATFEGEGEMAELVGGDGANGAALWSLYDLTGRVERLPAE